MHFDPLFAFAFPETQSRWQATWGRAMYPRSHGCVEHLFDRAMTTRVSSDRVLLYSTRNLPVGNEIDRTLIARSSLSLSYIKETLLVEMEEESMMCASTRHELHISAVTLILLFGETPLDSRRFVAGG
ncbi:hypothetical protein K437DRAFT_60246 [Tilletiaria anomala UBC 951]|uniref:Uncharacterized protein n=1 Tax=Tilletiaria anomala (strain ATCC 24038 / CBS 436.72 / UBC 951) TaxID=1037660 RepID=A0A066WE94_TILAU|nr:uncharacterized protein K437DRAFT_60246 [Tilletiaria anomala UBC 951]KDN50828.1 hypothetical protein K437DRAFT_60246 [Tilletiaria anomala UBC 951]